MIGEDSRAFVKAGRFDEAWVMSCMEKFVFFFVVEKQKLSHDHKFSLGGP